MTDDLRYPVGPFPRTGRLTDERRREMISQIEATPAALRAAVAGLDDARLDTPYRPDGWTVRQLVHHVADSHLNAYVRFRLALTEDRPAIKTYEEARWAELPDARTLPVEPSLTLLDSLHVRWVALLRALAPANFERTLAHPEWGTIDLDMLLGLYAWHGRHHVAHVTGLRQRMGR